MKAQTHPVLDIILRLSIDIGTEKVTNSVLHVNNHQAFQTILVMLHNYHQALHQEILSESQYELYSTHEID